MDVGIQVERRAEVTATKMTKKHRKATSKAANQMVEIGANRQSCEPSTTLLFKLTLETVLDHLWCERGARRGTRQGTTPSS